MNAEQWMKWRSWWAFYVGLPLVVYVAAGFFSVLSGKPFPVEDMIVKGDLLLLVIILLVTTLDWTVLDFILAPKTHVELQGWNQACFLVTILALFAYTMVYGWVVSSRLPGSLPIENKAIMIWFTILSLLGTICFCAAQNLSLLRAGRI
jgi:hypothetical protein